MVDQAKKLIEFEMFYEEKGLEFYVQVPYSERNWRAVMGIRRARNIKVVKQ